MYNPADLANPPAALTVDMVNQVRYAQERTGPCADCGENGPSKEQPADDPEQHVDEPHVAP